MWWRNLLQFSELKEAEGVYLHLFSKVFKKFLFQKSTSNYFQWKKKLLCWLYVHSEMDIHASREFTRKARHKCIVSVRETATANFGWETVHVEFFLLSTYYVPMEYANLYIKLYLAIGTYAITCQTMYTNFTTYYTFNIHAILVNKTFIRFAVMHTI